jgi:hypothetical protein
MDWCTDSVWVVAWADGQSIYACSSIFSFSENMGLCSYVCILFVFHLVPLLTGAAHTVLIVDKYMVQEGVGVLRRSVFLFN